MLHKKPLSLAVSCGLGLTTAFMIPAGAIAQDQQADENTDALLEEVIVTGSRIKRDGYDTVSPVSIISS